MDDATFDAYARAQGRLEAAGGYTWREQAMATIRGLGFDEDDLERELSTFSGGELTRGSLARVLVAKPDLLLLDEPTNHLDIASLKWLEQQLVQMDTAIMLVAPTAGSWRRSALRAGDRGGAHALLRRPVAQWRQEQASRELALGRAIDKQRKEIERMERFVERFRAKATKARQAQSRVKALDRIERIDRDPRDERELSFSFKAPERSGRVVYELTGARLEVPGRVLIDHGELWLERGEHVTLVGANGAGKSTLVKALSGQREFDAGKLLHRPQRAGRLPGPARRDDRRHRHRRPGRPAGHRPQREQGARAAGALPVHRRGGRQARQRAVGRRAPAPVAGHPRAERRQRADPRRADQPPRHREPRGAGGRAVEFPGTLLLVSHDPALLDAVGSRTVAVEEGTLHSYLGGWSEYLERRRARDEAAKEAKGAARAKAQPAPPTAGGNGNGNGKPSRSKNAAKRQAQLEKQIEQAEAELAALEAELADPSVWASPTGAQRSTQRHDAAKQKVAALMQEWETVAG